MKTITPIPVVGAIVPALCTPSHARITRIVIDEAMALPAPAAGAASSIAHEQLAVCEDIPRSPGETRVTSMGVASPGLHPGYAMLLPPAPLREGAPA